MKTIKVAVAALNQTPMAWENNRENIITAIREARRQKASVLCLPELCITGYGCEDLFFSPFLQEQALAILEEILPESKNLIVSVGIPLFFRNALFNTACLIADGKILGFAAKKNLAGDGVHYEPRWFKPWVDGVVSQIEINGSFYPLGDLYFNIGGLKIGFEICEDAWVAGRPGGELSALAVDLILNPSASHFSFGKNTVRKGFVIEGSRSFGVGYLYANLLGCEAGKIIYDGSCLIASGGKLLAEGKRFSYQEVVLTTALIDFGLNRMNQSRLASFRPVLEDRSLACVNCDFLFTSEENNSVYASAEKWESSAELKKEEFTKAISLGLYDYLRKSRNSGFVVSLSGGADSAAVSLLIRMMVENAIKDLGLQGFQEKFSHIATIQSGENIEQIMKELLICAYQSTRNSGEVTRNAAQKVAEGISATFYEFSIDNLVEDYKKIISGVLGRELNWQEDDLALQNVQARVRSPGIWLIANIKKALLLSTSNRSEAAVGYATMDGDTSGGLSPVGGIDKAFLREWLIWLEKVGPLDGENFPCLTYINQQQPTAELRPHEQKQTDENDLMPYTILEAIEKLAIRDKSSPVETFIRLKRDFSGVYSGAELGEWVKRFFRLWCNNQWKRERYAPAFHVDDKNLDPKTWCRFPILSGGYKKELESLIELLDPEKK